MDNYLLASDEVQLFAEPVSWEGRPGKPFLMLTSKAIVLTNSYTEGKRKNKKIIKTVDVFYLEEIKKFNDVPQIKQKIDHVNIQTVKGDIDITFGSLFSARKFASSLLQATTGNATFERGAGKFKGALGVVDNTLGIDTVGTVKGIVENGVVGSVLGGIKGKKKGKKATVAGAVEIAQELLTDNSESQIQSVESTRQKTELSYEQQIDAVKKMKELLDAGILTQEEFEAKKKEFLGL